MWIYCLRVCILRTRYPVHRHNETIFNGLTGGIINTTERESNRCILKDKGVTDLYKNLIRKEKGNLIEFIFYSPSFRKKQGYTILTDIFLPLFYPLIKTFA